MTRTQGWIACIVLAVAFAGCGGEDAGGGGTTNGGEPAGDPLATAKGSIAHQFELLKAQDVDALRACFTPRLRDRITAEAVKGAQAQAAKMTMDDLWASATEGEYQGHKTTKVTMKNDRTLTTLVLTDGQWLADTIWFK